MAYTRPCDGTSMAHPTHNTKGMEKAVRWVIASAEQAEMPEHATPTCTISTLPERKTSAYIQLMEHPAITSIDAIPAEYHNYTEP